ncbi:hypothetical protein J2X56_001131 [Herbaspirillum sp. 1173]|uniref:hypothetical protein n=1 Tax=Herbaspirillum sp. 1173 TaxID=2817734 RepID=UPI002863E5B7|nr:hypothetical protein [Herbaspirillum sp. 1173]MDR6739145.1 hypothetical protein [Herbaspirillum sp. 1173]
MVKSAVNGGRAGKSPLDLPRVIALILAIPATALGVALAGYVGWYRAGSSVENGFWMAVGCVTVLGTHFLPIRFADQGKGRAAAMAIWICCLGLAIYSHATFYLLSQEHAGQKRAAAVHIDQGDQSLTDAAPRSLLAIVNEREKVSVDLARNQAYVCSSPCPWREVRSTALRARLDTLTTEETAVRRWQHDRDQAAEIFRQQKDAARQDLVAAKLSEVLDVSVDDINVTQAFLFAVVLEGLACLGWLFALSADRPLSIHQGPAKVSPGSLGTSLDAALPGRTEVADADGQQKTSESVSNSEQSSDWTEQMPGKETPREVRQVWLEAQVRAGKYEPTVVKVREFLGCSQPLALDFTRHLKAVMAQASQKSVT